MTALVPIEDLPVGSVIIPAANPDERWEVIASSPATPVDGQPMTPWLRVQKLATGEEATIQPRPLGAELTAFESPTEILVARLGAEVIGIRDDETGRVHCPPAATSGQLVRHLRDAHKHPVDDSTALSVLHHVHQQAHDPNWPNIGKDGFAHTHTDA